MNAAERIIVALDLPGVEAVEAALAQLPEVRFVKVGMELFYSTGPELVKTLKNKGLRVFLDLKIHDIPNTASGALRSLSGLGCDFLNLHCAGGLAMMQKAREAVGPTVKLIGVTQLTSTDQRVLNEELGIAGTVQDSVLKYAKLAKKAGLDGVVCSPLEVRLLKAELGPEFLAVTPGVRPLGTALQDQKRTLTPQEAINAGSDYLVVGRPILKAADPRAAFLKILEEIEVQP